jgi:hypothetical protein
VGRAQENGVGRAPEGGAAPEERDEASAECAAGWRGRQEGNVGRGRTAWGAGKRWDGRRRAVRRCGGAAVRRRMNAAAAWNVEAFMPGE